MEGFVAGWYAKNMQKELDDYRARAREIAARVPADGRVLDLAPGPGYLAIELAKLGKLRVEGLDISQSFVRIATEKSRQAGVEIAWHLGDASAMPFDDGLFDFVVCRAAFKNFADPAGALSEMHRVLKPTGEALILDLHRDATFDDIEERVAKMDLGSLNAFVVRMTFRHLLLKRAYTKADFERLVASSPFPHHEIRERDIELEVHLFRQP